MNFKSEFLKKISARGFIKQGTNNEVLDQLLCGKNVVSYIGFDCTASSLHIGSLLPIMMLRHFQKCGHKPIILMGGGTTQVGDPSGKDKTREILDYSKIQENMQSIQKVFAKFLDIEDKFDSTSNKAFIANNADWLDELKYIDFLRDYGSHFSINKMLSFDSVRARLDREQHLSFLEFNYMIMQAYDFVELNKRYNCRLQMGGSDQWGNIVNGMELARKIDDVTEELFGLTTPLLTTASGKKMGKTEGGAVWLDKDLTTPYNYFQYWRNIDDTDAKKFLLLFTELEEKEIDEITENDINEAKKMLAYEATSMCHGKENAHSASVTAQSAFGVGNIEDLPKLEISKDEISSGLSIIELLVSHKHSSSNGEAKKLVRGGAVRINDVIINIDFIFDAKYFVDNDNAKLSIGKKKHFLVTVV